MISLLALGLLSAVYASDVNVLTNSNFDGFIADNSLTLVEFYAPWCGHCKSLAPEYEKAATSLKKNNLKIAKVDCTVETDVCSKFGVQGYPTLKIFKNGSPIEYKGPRTADGIIGTLQRQSLPAVSKIEDGKLEEFIDSAKVVVVGLFSESNSAEATAFADTADFLRENFVFGTTSDAKALAKHGVSAPAILLFKKFDEKLNIYNGKFYPQSIGEFIQANSVPLMDDIGPDNYETYMKKNLPILYLFVSNAEDKKTVGAQVEPLAKEYQNKISFVYIDAVKFGGHAESVNLKQEFPALGLADMAKSAKYPYDQTKKIVKADVKKFLDSFVAGTLKPSFKSEAIPETQDGPVTIVVGNNFESILKNVEHDTLVEFYAPWCGHCKKLAPIWDELGEWVKKYTSKIVIAKMDATANDFPAGTPYTVQGFPTLKFYKGETGEILDYEGDRTLEALQAFLKTNAHFKSELAESSETPAASEEHDEL